jgi:aspartate kinase
MLLVKKYGGKTVSTPAQLKKIAESLAADHQKGIQQIVVVSAMGKTTDELIRLAYEVSPKPDRRELDMLLTTGERVSMALLAMALKDLGAPAISFTGSQAGIMTDNVHSQARVIDIKPIRIEQTLKQNQIVTLAGFQGVNPDTKEITTLGRGGSDTTAVAMAAHFKADRCMILKDVDGVFSCDPKKVDNVKFRKEVSYDSLVDMCFWGAQFLHFRSAVLASQYNVPLFIGSASDPTKGTLVKKGSEMFEIEKFVAVNGHKKVIRLEANGDGATLISLLYEIVTKASLPRPQVLSSGHAGSTGYAYITTQEENWISLKEVLKNTTIKIVDESLASVSITCSGTVDAQVPSTVAVCMQKSGVNAEAILFSPLSVSVIVKKIDEDKALKAIHSLVE